MDNANTTDINVQTDEAWESRIEIVNTQQEPSVLVSSPPPITPPYQQQEQQIEIVNTQQEPSVLVSSPPPITPPYQQQEQQIEIVNTQQEPSVLVSPAPPITPPYQQQEQQVHQQQIQPVVIQQSNQPTYTQQQLTVPCAQQAVNIQSVNGQHTIPQGSVILMQTEPIDASMTGQTATNVLMSQPDNAKTLILPENEIDDYMTSAKLVTIFCCFLFGLIGIIKAEKCQKARDRGDIQKAKEEANSAKMWTICGLIAGLVFFGIGFLGLILIFT